MDWEKIKNAVTSFLSDGGLKILKALLVFIVGFILIKLVMKIVKSIFSKTSMEKITQSFLLSIIKFVLNLILIITVLQSLGIATTGLIALISAAGLAVSLALQNSLSNLANGVVIITTKPFREGDYVSINGVEGSVKNIKMLTTSIVTADNKMVVLPNSSIVTNEVVNYNALKTRKVTFAFDVDYASDINQVKQIILDVMTSNGKVRLEPAPFVALKTLKDSSLGFTASCWVDCEDYWSVYYYVMENVFNELKRNNINIPFNQVEVRLRNDEVVMPVNKDALPLRVEKERPEQIEGDIVDNLFYIVNKKIKKSEENWKKTNKEKAEKKAKQKAEKLNKSKLENKVKAKTEDKDKNESKAEKK